jgi:hypothetical protein
MKTLSALVARIRPATQHDVDQLWNELARVTSPDYPAVIAQAEADYHAARTRRHLTVVRSTDRKTI